MPNKIHKNASTTPKVRQEIQKSNESNRKLSRKFGVDIATVRKWRSRDFVTDAPIIQKKTRFSFSPWQEFLILHLRCYLYIGLDDLLTITNQYIKPNTSRSALSRLLKKHSVSKMFSILPIPENKSHGVHLKSSPLGTLQVSMVPTVFANKKYLFIAYEHGTRYLFSGIMEGNKVSSWLKECIKASPVLIQNLLLDSLVLARASDLLKVADGLQLPYTVCTIIRPELQIPATPRLNLITSGIELATQTFNQHTPLHALRNITPFAQCLALQQSDVRSSKKNMQKIEVESLGKRETTTRIKKYVDMIYADSYALGSVHIRSTNNNGESKMANANEIVTELMGTEGAVAAIIVDSDSGLVLAAKSNGFDTDTAAAGNTRVMQAKRDTMKMLKLDDKVEDILITLGSQLHLIALLPSNDAIFGYLVVDKSGANLGMARAKLKSAMASLTI